MDELIHRILDTVKATSYVLYLSAGRLDTFRAKLNPDYKANRTQPKPLHYDVLKKHLIGKWNAEVQVDQEADDAISIAQTKDPDNTIGCTIDKDILYGVIGHKYNFVKDVFSYVGEDEALLFFYKQMLIGDTADNIKGVEGIGPVKANKIMDSYLGEPEIEMFKVVYELYEQDLNRLRLNGRMLWMRKQEEQLWKIPKEFNLEVGMDK